MSLDSADVALVRDVVVGAIEALVIPRFDEQDERLGALDRDMSDVKQDVSILKQDVSTLKQDVSGLKQDVFSLKQDMREVKVSLHNLEGTVEALEADIKELYAMVTKAQKQPKADRRIAGMSFEQKVVRAYDDILLLAKEAGIVLPR